MRGSSVVEANVQIRGIARRAARPPGYDLYFPPGRHKIQKTIKVTSGARVGAAPNAVLVADDLGNAPILDASGTEDVTIENISVDLRADAGKFPIGLFLDGSDNARIRNFNCTNSGDTSPNATIQGILARWHSRLSVEGVRSTGCQLKLAGPGGDVRKLRVKNVVSVGARNHGISLVLTEPAGHVIDDVIIERCAFDSPWRAGLFLGDDGPTNGNVVRNVIIQDVRFYPSPNLHPGIQLHACDRTEITFRRCGWVGEADAKAVNATAYLANQTVNLTFENCIFGWDFGARVASPGAAWFTKCRGRGQTMVHAASLAPTAVTIQDCHLDSLVRASIHARSRDGVPVIVAVRGGRVAWAALEQRGGSLLFSSSPSSVEAITTIRGNPVVV